MQRLDWVVLIASLAAIVIYGVWKGRGSRDIQGYLLADRELRWFPILLSIMATQASAITFLSAPGQAYVDGIRFVQFYLGLPLAMIILSITAIPLYHRLKVYTAYEYLEHRFDVKTRSLAALLFLTQRGLAAGLTIYAPSLILSVLLGWDLSVTTFAIGSLVVIYTALGGTRAVNWTQFQQMLIIGTGMVAAFFTMVFLLPQDVSFGEAVTVAGRLGKLNAIDFSFDLNNRYTIWSGLIGGLFLQLSYFGTDQSQVQRYLTGRSVAHSRMAVLSNGMVKIPMQFSILFMGALLFVFYQFHTPPLFFNPVQSQQVKESIYAEQFRDLESRHRQLAAEKEQALRQWLQQKGDENNAASQNTEHTLSELTRQSKVLRTKAKELIVQNDPEADDSDTNYIFLTFVLNFLPVGLVGLVLAAIFSASMSSTASELNALASTTIVDIYRRNFKKQGSDRHYLIAAKFATLLWGSYAILLA
ncbi:MAG: sodium:solute symporter, partial [Calditrichia bacterium]